MTRRSLFAAALVVAWSGPANAGARGKGPHSELPAPARLADPPPPAPAKKPAKDAPAPSVELLVLHATHAKSPRDPRLSDLEELEKPPFSSYESYRLIDRAKFPLAKGEPKTRRLPNGRVLRTELAKMVGADAVRLVASINQPGAPDFLPLLEVTAKIGQRFIVAGQRYQSGILVLVLRVVP